jgi:hypothetical protein
MGNQKLNNLLATLASMRPPTQQSVIKTVKIPESRYLPYLFSDFFAYRNGFAMNAWQRKTFDSFSNNGINDHFYMTEVQRRAGASTLMLTLAEWTASQDRKVLYLTPDEHSSRVVEYSSTNTKKIFPKHQNNILFSSASELHLADSLKGCQIDFCIFDNHIENSYYRRHYDSSHIRPVIENWSSIRNFTSVCGGKTIHISA